MLNYEELICISYPLFFKFKIMHSLQSLEDEDYGLVSVISLQPLKIT